MSTKLQTAETTGTAAVAALVPPCVIDVWAAGIEQHPGCASALVRLLLERPERVHEISSIAAAETSIHARMQDAMGNGNSIMLLEMLRGVTAMANLTGHLNEAIAACRTVLDQFLAQSGPVDRNTEMVAHDLIALYKRAGAANEAFLVDFRLRVKPLLDQNTPENFTNLRSAAFDAYEAGCFAGAAAIYRAIMIHPLERAGTHSHLARVLLAMGQEQEAASEVTLGLQQLGGGDEPYVPGRLYYLAALLATLAGQDATEPLRQLELCAQRSSGRNAWLLSHVLNYVRPRLTADSYELFQRLGQMLGNTDARSCAAVESAQPDDLAPF